MPDPVKLTKRVLREARHEVAHFIDQSGYGPMIRRNPGYVMVVADLRCPRACEILRRLGLRATYSTGETPYSCLLLPVSDFNETVRAGIAEKRQRGRVTMVILSDGLCNIVSVKDSGID